MDALTIYITIALFGIIFVILFGGFSVIAKTKKQTQGAIKEIEYQIKRKAIEKAVEVGMKAGKNLYKNSGTVLKSIIKNIPFKFGQAQKAKPKTEKTKTTNKKTNSRTAKTK